jgi:hypothetical protein
MVRSIHSFAAKTTEVIRNRSFDSRHDSMFFLRNQVSAINRTNRKKPSMQNDPDIRYRRFIWQNENNRAQSEESKQPSQIAYSTQDRPRSSRTGSPTRKIEAIEQTQRMHIKPPTQTQKGKRAAGSTLAAQWT